MIVNYDLLKEEICEILNDFFIKTYNNKIEKSEILPLISETKDFKNGDFCIPLFLIAKKIGINPNELSKTIFNYFNENIIVNKGNQDYSLLIDLIEKLEATGPYINFFIDKKYVFSKLILSNDFFPFHYEKLKDYTVVIDYSSCNIAKPYGIGHIMSTAIGESLKRCYEYLGSNAIGINYIGDWGTQFGKVLLAYKLWGDEQQLNEKGVYYLYDLYVRFHQEEEKDPNLKEEAKIVFQKLEEHDSYYYQLWEKFRKISLDNFKNYYQLFGNTFSYNEGESKYGKKNIEDVLRILELNQIVEESEGAKVVFLDDIYPNENIPPCIIKKSDGTTTYALRDIAAVLDRWQRFHFDEALYVINIGQNLHIKQFTGVLKKLNLHFADSIKHVAFGTMTFSGQKMQTRKGTILFLQDIYNEVYNQALNITKEKNIAENAQDTAKKLATAAIVFSILKNQRIKDIDFDFGKVLSFEGDTAAYLQYTCVRIKSILKKANIDLEKIFCKIESMNNDLTKKSSENDNLIGQYFYQICIDNIKNTEDLNEKEGIKILIDRILFEIFRFDEIVENVVKEKEPYLLSRYLLKLAMLFNQFYSKVKVLEGNEDEVMLKVAFIMKIEKVLTKGLELLGIEIPESL